MLSSDCSRARGVDGRGSDKGEVEEDERAMAGASELGRRMVGLISRNMKSN